MATLRRCAESLTPDEGTLLSESAATLPANWTVDVVAWPEVNLGGVHAPSPQAPLPELEVRVVSPTSFQVAAFGRPAPAQAAAAFIRACAKNGGAT